MYLKILRVNHQSPFVYWSWSYTTFAWITGWPNFGVKLSCV